MAEWSLAPGSIRVLDLAMYAGLDLVRLANNLLPKTIFFRDIVFARVLR